VPGTPTNKGDTTRLGGRAWAMRSCRQEELGAGGAVGMNYGGDEKS
jgi:hypothetical protein